MVDLAPVLIGSGEPYREVCKDGNKLPEHEVHERKQGPSSYHTDKGHGIQGPVGPSRVSENTLNIELVSPSPGTLDWLRAGR